jgi:hypothetical protein
LLDERFGGEAVRREDLDAPAEDRAQISDGRGSTRSEEPTEKDTVGAGPLDPLRQIFEVTAAKLVAVRPGNADSELSRRFRTLAAIVIPYGSWSFKTYSLLIPSCFAIRASAAPWTSSAATTRAKFRTPRG